MFWLTHLPPKDFIRQSGKYQIIAECNVDHMPCATRSAKTRRDYLRNYAENTVDTATSEQKCDDNDNDHHSNINIAFTTFIILIFIVIRVISCWR